MVSLKELIGLEKLRFYVNIQEKRIYWNMMIFTLYPWLAIKETSLSFFTAPVTLHENE